VADERRQVAALLVVDESLEVACADDGPSIAAERSDLMGRSARTGVPSCSGVEDALASCEAELAMNLGREQPWPDDGPGPDDTKSAARDAASACMAGHPFAMEVDCGEYPCIVWILSSRRMESRLFCSEWELTRGRLSYRSGSAIGDGLEVMEFSVSAPEQQLESDSPDSDRRWDYRTDAAAEWVFDSLRERLHEDDDRAKLPR
jgi:hypothetical protein